MKYRVFLSAFFILFAISAAQAEYRVFILKISKKPAAGTNAPGVAGPPAANAGVEATADLPAFRLVTSTLDPEQYRYYYPVAPDEEITYIDTWRCYGRTDNFQPFCPNPKDQIAPEANPAP